MHVRLALPLIAAIMSCSAKTDCAGCGPDPVGPIVPAATVPGALFAPAIAFDSRRNQLVVVGGEGNNRALPRTTWMWNGTQWTSSEGGPSGRFWSAMAYDVARQRLVLFGGAGSGGALADTWEFDGATWTLRTTTNGPAPRYAHEMAYDAARGRVVMFGGNGGFGSSTAPLNDLWAWDGTQWQQLEAQSLVGGRFAFAFAFDGARNQLVGFGGYGTSGTGTSTPGSLRDTWINTGGTWTQSSGEQGPSARDHTSMAYDAARQRIVLYGGSQGGGGPLTDTWEWNGSAWTRAATTGPDVHGNHRLVYDSARQAVLLWTSPADGSAVSDVWSWNGSQWNRVSQ